MKLTTKQKETLSRFEDLVSELGSSRISKKILDGKAITYRYPFTSDGKRQGDEIVGFDEEELKSFILSCRLLVQNNEKTSLGNIGSLFAKLPEADVRRGRCEAQRWLLNSFLDSRSVIQFSETECLTHRDVLHTFLYGLYAHRSEKKHRIIQQWRGDPVRYPHMQIAFLMGLSRLLAAAKEISILSEQYRNEN